MITSKQRSLIGLAALLSYGALIQACGSSDPGTSMTTPSAGAAGAHAGATGVSGGSATSAGAPSAGAGAPAAGFTSAGASNFGGASFGGASAGLAGTGTGGAMVGTGGATGGSGGSASAGAGGASTSSPTFAAVKTLIGTYCGIGPCHNKSSGKADFQGTTDLHALLTTPLPAGVSCKGSVLAVPNDLNSFLLTIVKMPTSCPMGGGNLAQMPDNCGKAGKMVCLTAVQQKVLSDWIAAGAPK